MGHNPKAEKKDKKMENQNYATPWLERREKTEKPDEDFIEMLEEIFRGRTSWNEGGQRYYESFSHREGKWSLERNE